MKRLSLCIVLVLAACNRKPVDSAPGMDQTMAYMQNVLMHRNGQRIEKSIPGETLANSLQLQSCKLTYTISNFVIVHYDLSDIDTTTIKIEQIGELTWVTFHTRDFHHSVQYDNHSAGDKPFVYDSETGGFALDSKEVAVPFQKALARAAVLCGSKPSTF